MTGQLVILSPLILFFIFLLLTIPRLNVLHFSIPLPMEEEEVWERRSYSKYSIGFTLCCLSRVSTKNVTTPMCVCVCVETRKKKTNKESFSILVGKDIPSIHLSGRSKRGLLLRVKTFGLSSCCVPCLMTLFTSLVSHRVFLVCFVYRNHIPPPHLNTKRIPLKEGKQRKTTTKGWPASVTYFGRACRLNPPPIEYQKLYGNIKTHNKFWVRRKPNPSPKKREILSIFSIRQVKILAKAILIGLKTFSLDPIDKFQWKY